MMKRTAMVLGLLLVFSGLLNAQYVIKSTSELEALKKLPLEKIYLHSNTDLLFPGEYLYYSTYCMNAATNKLSSISRMAYVELIGEDLQTVFRQKVRLVGGRGQGDFFMPTSVASGNYKLVGYTQWMKNAPLTQLFQTDIVIINPYRNEQELIISNDEAPKNTTNTTKKVLREDKSILLMPDRSTYGKREKVSLLAKNFKGPLGYGDYSLSVRRKETLNTKGALRAQEFGEIYLQVDKTLSRTVNDSIFLPEQRGELFFGTVLDNNNQPVVDETIVLSIPGQDFQLKSAITDTDGNFYTYVNKPYNATQLLAQTLNKDSGQHRIFMKRRSSVVYDDLKFGNFYINQNDKKTILERSVHNQIENAYYSVKPDSILSINKKDPYDGGVPEVILLDEFTRFPTLRETLIELVPNVWVKKLDEGSYTFWVREDLESYENDFVSDPPLVLVDGVFVPDHKSLLEFNARVIEKISILRDPLVLGSKKYLGMVVINTFEGDYLERIPPSNMAKYELNLPVADKNYFNQSYKEEMQETIKRIPDFRHQLFWEPNFSIGEGTKETTFEFYTSDVSGEYDIFLEGFTRYGKPISVKGSFTVD